MTDTYKISLDILYRLLKDSDNDFWANWIEKDIDLWTNEKRTDHHISAYGGMGSINDLFVGGLDNVGVWKNHIFETTKVVSWSLAKGKITVAPLDEKFYKYGLLQISGWRCRNCGQSKISKSNVEEYLCTILLPNIFVKYISQDKLIEILNIDEIINSKIVTDKRHQIEKLIQSENIELVSHTNWEKTCTNCQSDDVCVYRWDTLNQDIKLVEAKDNLKINKRPAYNTAYQKCGHTSKHLQKQSLRERLLFWLCKWLKNS